MLNKKFVSDEERRFKIESMDRLLMQVRVTYLILTFLGIVIGLLDIFRVEPFIESSHYVLPVQIVMFIVYLIVDIILSRKISSIE